MSTWQGYYQNTKDKPPSKWLLEALPFVKNKVKALDLGAGALVESKYLLSLGFEVVAVDKELFRGQIVNGKFTFVQSAYGDYAFPVGDFDLVTAQYALPFNGQSGFTELWEKIVSSLKPDGVFVGQLFGPRDEWNVDETKLAFHTRAQIEALLAGLEVLKLEEVEKDGKLANGSPKHWHIFHIIFRRNS